MLSDVEEKITSFEIDPLTKQETPRVSQILTKYLLMYDDR